MRRLCRLVLALAAASVAGALLVARGDHLVTAPAPAQAAGSGIGFEVPSIVDPIHTFGEPDIGLDKLGRVFSSGPTGTGTQRSQWEGSVDRGHSLRLITPLLASPIVGTPNQPGGGDTDINFDQSGKQYFTDLFALTCVRVATTADGGATASSTPTGCATNPGADRQWLAVYDPPGSSTSPYTGLKPLVYLEYNNLVGPGPNGGATWNKSTDGLTYLPATNGDQAGATLVTPATEAVYSPFGRGSTRVPTPARPGTCS